VPDEQLVALDRLAAAERHADDPVARHADRALLDRDVDAALAQAGLDLLGGERLLAAEQPRAGLEEGHLRPERLPRLGQLAADDPAAETMRRPGPPSPSSPPGSSTAPPRPGPGRAASSRPSPSRRRPRAAR
jgi:hypothetical protein